MKISKISKVLLPLVFGFQFLNAQIKENPKIQENIKYQESERKKIEYNISKKYGLDTMNIHFEVLSKDNSLGVFGFYSPSGDSLMLDYYRIIQVCQEYYLNSDTLLEETMRHELAHYEVDKMQEKFDLKSEMGNKYSKNLISLYFDKLKTSESEQGKSIFILQDFVKENSQNLTNIILDKMVNEGIGKYYENLNAKPIITVWPSSIVEINTYSKYDRCVYAGGLKLMYPILSTYGNKGIECVLKNMPKYKDFSDLEGYQKRILEKLAKEK